MTAPLTLYLIRHGEVYNPDHILYGRLPNYRLSDTGREQAVGAGEYLAGENLDAFFASPMQRAQETANIILSKHKQALEIVTEERINECYTPHQGKTYEEMDAIRWDLYTGNEPPYETAADLRRRLLDFVADMRKTYPNGTVAGVTHGDIVVSAFMHSKGQDENDIGRHRDEPNMMRLVELGLPERYPATACIIKLVYKTNDADELPEYEYIVPYNID